MQAMKEKIDMMINAMRGRVSTNLDELVHQTDSPFTTQVTSCPLPTKFQVPQVETYNKSRDPLDLLNHSRPLCTCKES